MAGNTILTALKDFIRRHPGAVSAGLIVAGSLFIVRSYQPKPAKVAREAPFNHLDPAQLPEYKSTAGRPGQYSSTRRDQEGKIRYAKEGVASRSKETGGIPAQTIPALLALAEKNSGDGVALRVERPCPAFTVGDAKVDSPIRKWKSWTYKEYRNEVRTVAKAFMKLGLERFDAVTIYGFNAPEWHMSELACIEAGGIAAGIYPSDTAEQVTFKARHSGAVIAACQGIKQAKVFLTAKAQGHLPKLKAIVVWAASAEELKALPTSAGLSVLSWGQMPEMAAETSERQLDQRVASQRPGHTCTYIYTSGTTGNPKAVMVTHDNIVYEASVVMSLLRFLCAEEGRQDRILSYLPLSHVAGMMVDIVSPIVATAHRPGVCTVHFARAYDLKKGTLGDRLRVVKPTLFLGVPRVWEKISEKMKALIAANPLSGPKLMAARWAKSQGIAHQHNCQMGGSGAKGFGYCIARKLVLDKVKQKLGLDCCKFGFTGAAPITVETLTYFGALGIQINEVYGMSECIGASTWSSDDAHVWGSCGWRMPGAEVKVFRVNPADLDDKTECPRAADLEAVTEAEQGEICFRGRHIMAGYMANPDLGAAHVEKIQAKLRAAIDTDGWLHSGDKGCIDRRGMVKITGRYKELIIGAGGENIAPVPVENGVKRRCAGIANVMMIGDKRKFNIALITLKAKGATGEQPGTNHLDGAALAISPGVTTIPDAAKDRKWEQVITAAIEATNKDGKACPSNAAKIRKYCILPADFSVQTGELTPTLKLKRSVVCRKHKFLIEHIYASKEVHVPYIST